LLPVSAGDDEGGITGGTWAVDDEAGADGEEEETRAEELGADEAGPDAAMDPETDSEAGLGYCEEAIPLMGAALECPPDSPLPLHPGRWTAEPVPATPLSLGLWLLLVLALLLVLLLSGLLLVLSLGPLLPRLEGLLSEVLPRSPADWVGSAFTFQSGGRVCPGG